MDSLPGQPPPPRQSRDQPCGLREERPWGWFETLGGGSGYLLKRLCIAAGRRISRQRHRQRCEHWVVVAGEGSVECDGRQLRARPGTTLFIPVGAIHRASAGHADLVIIEVQRGELLREDDIERLADDFGRAPDQGPEADQRPGERADSGN